MTRRAVLLTWNPRPHDDRRFTPLQWHDTLVAPHARGEAVTTSWGVGRHVNGFEPGQPVYLSTGRAPAAAVLLTWAEHLDDVERESRSPIEGWTP